jgi:hypothetical protein
MAGGGAEDIWRAMKKWWTTKGLAWLPQTLNDTGIPIRKISAWAEFQWHFNLAVHAA